MLENFSFIHEQIEIKVLILFLMRRLPESVAHDVLTDLVMCDDGIGYFEVTECITNLVETDHIKMEDGKYSLTAKGDHNGKILEKNLPYTVMIRAENAAALVRANLNRDAMIKTDRRDADNGGYKITLSLSDGIGDILSIELLAANEEQANALEKGFRKNAEEIYHSIIKMITVSNS